MADSDIAMKILAKKIKGSIKTNAQFWSKFWDKVDFKKEELKEDDINEINKSKLLEGIDGFICAYDKNFPEINQNVKNNSEKPYLLFYRGDISLLSDLNNNVAVIGLTDPDKEIIDREKKVVKALVKENLVIVSGLAIGCDEIAHETCLNEKGKTIAVLPTQVQKGKIWPLKNQKLAEDIVKNGGLLISEYYNDADNSYEKINRLTERDRLQAMFSKAIILIASYRKDEGDSGSRHAMEAARKYNIRRYIMFNITDGDGDNKKFGLNKDLYDAKDINKIEILTEKSIKKIRELVNPNLCKNATQNIVAEDESLFNEKICF